MIVSSCKTSTYFRLINYTINHYGKFILSKIKINLSILFTIPIYLIVISIFDICFAEQTIVNSSTPSIDKADTAWMLTSTVLVLMMTIPGLFLFYSGLVRTKNVLGTMMHSFIIAALIAIQWVLWGYSISFGPDIGGFIGSLDWVALKGVGAEPNPEYADNIPHLVFMVFQMTFAIITPALITGAFAERAKFSTFLIFILLWATFIYDPLAHWVWGGGWIGNMGALDFAGGTVVHISSGASALAAAIMYGKRIGYGRESMAPHFLPFSIIGASLLWVGWFGFNAGSALAADGLASIAFVTTNTATASAVLTWMLVEWLSKGKPTVLGPATGAVAGLVAITPAAGFVTPIAAIWIGIGAGVFCYAAVNLKIRFRFDDSLDVVAVHGIGGTWGAIATGLFASTAVNPSGSDGLFFGNPQQLKIQFIAVIATWVFTFFGSILILSILKAIMGLRVSVQEEFEGLDIIEHGQVAYSGFQIIHSLGKSEMLALQKEIDEVEERKKEIIKMIDRYENNLQSKNADQHELEAAQNSSSLTPFTVRIENISKDELKLWWEELCNKEYNYRPEDFNFIFQRVTKFHDYSIHFKSGNPDDVIKRLEKLLEPFNASIKVVTE